MIKFIIFIIALAPILSWSQSIYKRFERIEDLRLSMFLAGYNDPNPEIFKKEVMDGNKGDPEEVIKNLERVQPQVIKMIKEESEREEKLKSSKKRLKEIDPNSVTDPVLKDLIQQFK